MVSWDESSKDTVVGSFGLVLQSAVQASAFRVGTRKHCTQERYQSIFSAIRPILVRMLRIRKKQTVAAAIATSATQKAMSQL